MTKMHEKWELTILGGLLQLLILGGVGLKGFSGKTFSLKILLNGLWWPALEQSSISSATMGAMTEHIRIDTWAWLSHFKFESTLAHPHVVMQCEVKHSDHTDPPPGHAVQSEALWPNRPTRGHAVQSKALWPHRPTHGHECRWMNVAEKFEASGWHSKWKFGESKLSFGAYWTFDTPLFRA